MPAAAGLAYHFLHTDYVASARLTNGIGHIIGPQASGGQREYVQIWPTPGRKRWQRVA
ncbi:MAG: hypothetical protein R2911_00175 [Caldilineaceae bacterium]